MMLLNLAQLQAVDFILKIISTQNNLRPIKMVIEYNSKLISGDFVIMEDYRYKESRVSYYGALTHQFYDYEDGSKNEALPRVWNEYTRRSKNLVAAIIQNDLAFLHYLLIELVSNSNTQDSGSKLRPYLYNVEIINDSITLPFIELISDSFNFVSLISKVD